MRAILVIVWAVRFGLDFALSKFEKAQIYFCAGTAPCHDDTEYGILISKSLGTTER